jgi:hypothetical protein
MTVISLARRSGRLGRIWSRPIRHSVPSAAATCPYARELDFKALGRRRPHRLVDKHPAQRIDLGLKHLDRLAGQANRVNILPCDKADQEVVIPGSELSAQLEGVLAGGIPDQVAPRQL